MKRVALVIALVLFVFVGVSYGDDRNGKDEVETEEPERQVDCRMITSATSMTEGRRASKTTKFRSKVHQTPEAGHRDHEDGHMFRTVLRNGMKWGPNFAGHYAVVVWGCGTSCSSFAVVNLRTGQVITLLE